MSETKIQLLADVRDTLLLDLRGIPKSRNFYIRIDIDNDHDCLTVLGANPFNLGLELGFAIGRKSIEDNVYRETFKTQMEHLIMHLETLDMRTE